MKSTRGEGDAAMATVTVRDEVFPGGQATERTLDLLAERVTVRELMRSRIYQEVTEHNAARARAALPPLLDPTPPEGVSPPRVDWEQQYTRALAAFCQRRFLLLVDDRQITDLDDEVALQADTRVTFLRLVPLRGG